MLILLNETFFCYLFHISAMYSKRGKIRVHITGQMRLCLASSFELNA